MVLDKLQKTLTEEDYPCGRLLGIHEGNPYAIFNNDPLFSMLCERLFNFYTQQHDEAKADADQQISGRQGCCLKELLQERHIGDGQL